ncbi:uncharacterized protein [Ptychodera flava]|uniref:uncharacterized protein n=1 Tax=Ptychodera flava TaxID=63121 RepID=UPI00396A221C
MTGHGEINVQGGDGSGLGGGGAGGRVGIHCRWHYTYGGRFRDRGGSGSGNYNLSHGAAAGSVYVEENTRPLQYRIAKYLKELNTTFLDVDHKYVHIDNEGQKVPVASMIMEDNTVDYEFDEMELTGAARLLLYHPHGEQVTAVVHRFIGDKTGQFHLRNNQTVYVEVVESTNNRTEAPCSYIIDYGAEMIMPFEVHLQGTDTLIEGLLTGVHHLFVEENAHAEFTSTAQTAVIEDRVYTHITSEGNFSMPQVIIRYGGELKFTKVEKEMIFNSAFVEIKYRGRILLNHVLIESGNADLESEGELHLDGAGYPAGAGPGGAVSEGAGAGHGGKGGGSTSEGQPYGSVFTPVDLGSGGGPGHYGQPGGAGGGAVYWVIGTKIHLNGLISSKGEDAVINAAGGGSGGSVVIEATNMTGHGEINVDGGSGQTTGSGGAGGRIGVHVHHKNTYGGQYNARGGAAGSTHSNEAYGDGGPGTVYKFESDRGPQYREVKYHDPEKNITEYKPEHSMLKIDDGQLDSDNPAMVMEDDTLFYEFDEIQVRGHSLVHFYHPAEARNVTVVAHELLGDKSGQIVIRNRQRLFVDIVESTHTYLEIPCGIHVHDGGEAVLPTTVIIQAESLNIEGRMTGVKELILERQGHFILKGQGHTADLPSKADWYSDMPFDPYTPGLVLIGKVSINNLGQVTIDIDPVVSRLDIGNFIIKNGGLLKSESQKFEIFAGEMDIEPGGTIDAAGQGHEANAGPGAGTFSYNRGSGGAHASEGGSVLSCHPGPCATGGSPYGTVFNPRDAGSGGGGSGGGAGGGSVYINVGKDIYLDGAMSVNGLDGRTDTHDSYGGGSAGSIFIQAGVVHGHGVLTSDGGDGGTNSGGGSGGRIAIHVTNAYRFQGTLQALGGSGSDHGWPGTVYIKQSIGDTNITSLFIDNVNRASQTTQCYKPVELDESGQRDFHFDLVSLDRRACLVIKTHATGTSTLVIEKLTGDGTGTLSARGNDMLHIEPQEMKTYLPGDLRVHNNGGMVVPPKTTIRNHLTVQGALYGIEELFIKGYTTLYKSGYSTCRNCTDGSNELGQYWMGHLVVQHDGTLEASYSIRTTRQAIQIRTAQVFELEYNAAVRLRDSITVYSRDVKTELKSTVEGNAIGYGAASGPGAGGTCGGGGGAGHGGYGGPGGGTGTSNCHSSSRGPPYEDACLPYRAGSGGGWDSHSGRTPGVGGGATQIISGQHGEIEGTVTVNGGSSNDGSGGGSGGTTWLDARYMDGWGQNIANGGSASNHKYCSHSSCTHYGGGGAGGRIRTVSEYPHRVLESRCTKTGGSSTSNQRNGDSGTVCVSPTQCSNQGIWDPSTGQCMCNSGTVGFNCQIECDDDYVCNGHGTCTNHGGCECEEGYVGYRCEYQCLANTTCSGHGTCTPHGECICDSCYHGSDCSILCNGNGDCVDAECQCDPCFIGRYCHSECNHQGSCVNDTCSCSDNWRGDFCSVAGCPGEEIDCSGHGICNAGIHACYCEPGWTGDDCSSVDCPGDPNCFDRGYCNATVEPPQCQNCEKGWMGADCNETCVHGNQVPMDSGVCVCDPCWMGKNCDLLCSGFGQCSDDNTACECHFETGRWGEYCEILGCPGIDVPCSGHGDCNSAINECECRNGWIGIGCHIPDCPGNPDCAGRGFCNGDFDPPICQNCSRGWMGPACEDPCVNGIQTPMDSGYCNCSSGWTGVGCDVECSNNGKIVDGACECYYEEGWKGELCDIPGCPGLFGLDCSGRGECNSAIPECTCRPGWLGIGCELPDCPGHPDCAGRGYCNDTFDPPYVRTVPEDGWAQPVKIHV